MNLPNKIIEFQNSVERQFAEKKSVRNAVLFLLGFLTFLASNFAALFRLPFVVVSRFVATKSTGVSELNAPDFDEFISQKRLTLVKFGTDW